MVRNLHDLSTTSFFFFFYKVIGLSKTKPWLGPFLIFQPPLLLFFLSYWSFQNKTLVYAIHLHHDFNVWEHSRSWLWPSIFKKSMILQEVSTTHIIIFPTNHQEWVHSYNVTWMTQAPFVLQLYKSSYVGKSIIVHNKFACIWNYLYEKLSSRFLVPHSTLKMVIGHEKVRQLQGKYGCLYPSTSCSSMAQGTTSSQKVPVQGSTRKLFLLKLKTKNIVTK